jgi:hypothetical protein
MKTRIFLTALLFLIIGCSKNNPVSSNLTEDDVLKTRILGYWGSSPYGSITFRADNSYTDSSFFRSTIDTTKYNLNMVTEGQYAITNAVLMRTKIHVLYLDTAYYRGLGEIVWDFAEELQSVDKDLVLTPVKVLQLVQGTGNQLWGTWATTYCVYICGNTPTQVIYEGRQKETFTFVKDSSLFSYGWQYLDGSPYPNSSFTSEFTYDPPKLSLIGPSDYINSVQFKNGCMYWYYNYPSGKLGKMSLNKMNFRLTSRSS